MKEKTNQPVRGKTREAEGEKSLIKEKTDQPAQEKAEEMEDEKNLTADEFDGLCENCSDYFKAYIQEAAGIPLLTAEEEKMFGRLKDEGSAEERKLAVKKFFDSNQRLVFKRAWKNLGKGKCPVPVEDLIQEGNRALMEKAIPGFDYTKGCRFSTYAFWFIEKAIWQANGYDEGSSILRKKRDELETELNRMPTYKELAAALGISQEKLFDILNKEKLLDADSVDKADENGSCPAAQIPAREQKWVPYGELLKQQRRFKELTEREQTVLLKLCSPGITEAAACANTGRHSVSTEIISTEKPSAERTSIERTSIEDIAAELKISRARVRQIRDKALYKLNDKGWPEEEFSEAYFAKKTV